MILSNFFGLLALYIFSLNKNSKWSNAQFDTAQKNSKGIPQSYFEQVPDGNVLTPAQNMKMLIGEVGSHKLDVCRLPLAGVP